MFGLFLCEYLSANSIFLNAFSPPATPLKMANSLFLRFYGLDDLSRPILKEVKRAGCNAINYALRSPTSSNRTCFMIFFFSFTMLTTSIVSTPWTSAFRSVVAEAIRPGDHEFLNHPLACIVAISSDHPDPISALESGYRQTDVCFHHLVFLHMMRIITVLASRSLLQGVNYTGDSSGVFAFA
jgi:hypothetical protein